MVRVRTGEVLRSEDSADTLEATRSPLHAPQRQGGGREGELAPRGAGSAPTRPDARDEIGDKITSTE